MKDLITKFSESKNIVLLSLFNTDITNATRGLGVFIKIFLYELHAATESSFRKMDHGLHLVQD
jgi:hypothetical protein